MAELSRGELVRLAEQLYPLLVVIRGDRAIAADATLDVLDRLLRVEAEPGDALDLELPSAGAVELDPADHALVARHVRSLLRGEQLAAATGQPPDGIDERLRLLLTRFDASGGSAGDRGDASGQTHVPPQMPPWFVGLPPLPDSVRSQVEGLLDDRRRRDRRHAPLLVRESGGPHNVPIGSEMPPPAPASGVTGVVAGDAVAGGPLRRPVAWVVQHVAQPLGHHLSPVGGPFHLVAANPHVAGALGRLGPLLVGGGALVALLVAPAPPPAHGDTVPSPSPAPEVAVNAPPEQPTVEPTPTAVPAPTPVETLNQPAAPGSTPAPATPTPSQGPVTPTPTPRPPPLPPGSDPTPGPNVLLYGDFAATGPNGPETSFTGGAGQPGGWSGAKGWQLSNQQQATATTTQMETTDGHKVLKYCSTASVTLIDDPFFTQQLPHGGRAMVWVYLVEPDPAHPGHVGMGIGTGGLSLDAQDTTPGRWVELVAAIDTSMSEIAVGTLGGGACFYVAGASVVANP